ncbi:MAG: 6,7-dimethyl-8-ribityllumazine synthase [Candidatus Sumerlaeaceae bacterium]
MNEFRGTTEGAGLKFAIVASRYNDFVTQKLVDGAASALRENGVGDGDIDLFWCPGALELPPLVARVVYHGVKAKFFDGVIVVGCVIRGETDHYQFVAGEAMRGIAKIALDAKLAVGIALLTVESAQQAIERSGDKMMNKGHEAALAALEMVNLFRKIK